MFFSVARLRHALLSFILIAPASQARVDELFTSSVTYCAPPLSIVIDTFDVRYLSSNHSVFFNISAQSVTTNLTAAANLQLTVYGANPINLTIDLCSILDGALCPLPIYNFQGSEWLTIPSSVDIAKVVPAIAYKVPDLEAFAQLTLTDTKTNEVVACVQTTLSNGWSMHQPAVSWATGFIALFALLSALFHTARRLVHSPANSSLASTFSTAGALAPLRFIDLVSLYQVIAISGLFALDYPVVYRAYTLNFAWAAGIFYSQPVQTSINTLRHKTGGNLADNNGGSAVGLVNRKLSPYNALLTSAPTSLLEKVANLPMSDMFKDVVVDTTRRMVKRDVETVTPESNDVLQAGVPIWSNSIGIGTANTFMTVFFVVLMVLAVSLTLLAIGWGILEVLVKTERSSKESVVAARRAYPRFAKAWGIRLALIFIFPVLVFGFYQWTLKDSWVSILLSVITIICVLLAVIAPSYFLFRRLRQGNLPSPSSTPTTSLAPLYAHLRNEPKWTMFFIAPLIAIFVKALVIAFASSASMVQVVIALVVEFVLFVVLVVLRPHNTKGGNALSIYLSLTRLVSTALLIPFVESLDVAAIPRVAIGIVTAVILSLAVITLFFSVVLNTGLNVLLHNIRSRSHRRLDDQSSHASMAEKGAGSLDGNKKMGVFKFLVSAASRKTLHERPRNPTPDNNLRVSQIYPPATSPSTSTPPSPSQTSMQGSRASTAVGSRPNSSPPRRQYFPPSSASSESGYGSVLAEGGLFSGPRASQFSQSTSGGGQWSRRNSAYELSRQPTVDEHGSVSEGETEDHARDASGKAF